MNIITSRAPQQKDILLLLSSTTIIVHFWVIFHLLSRIPAVLRFLTLGELLGFAGYVLFIAVIEILFFVSILIILSILLPRKFLHSHLVSQGTLSVIIFAFWATVILAQGDQISSWNIGFLLIEFVLVAFMVHRFRMIDYWIYALADRAILLSWIYLTVDLLLIIYAAFRYIFII